MHSDWERLNHWGTKISFLFYLSNVELRGWLQVLDTGSIALRPDTQRSYRHALGCAWLISPCKREPLLQSLTGTAMQGPWSLRSPPPQVWFDSRKPFFVLFLGWFPPGNTWHYADLFWPPSKSFSTTSFSLWNRFTCRMVPWSGHWALIIIIKTLLLYNICFQHRLLISLYTFLERFLEGWRFFVLLGN